MVEKTYHLTPYWGPMGLIYRLSDIYGVQNMFTYTKMIVGTCQLIHVIFNLAKNDPQRKTSKNVQKNIFLDFISSSSFFK